MNCLSKIRQPFYFILNSGRKQELRDIKINYINNKVYKSSGLLRCYATPAFLIYTQKKSRCAAGTEKGFD